MTVNMNGVNMKSHPIDNGVKHGCVPTSTLFSIVFGMMHKMVTADIDAEDGVDIR